MPIIQAGYDQSINDWLTFREYEYLKIIRRKNVGIYYGILDRIKEIKQANCNNEMNMYLKDSKQPNEYV